MIIKPKSDFTMLPNEIGRHGLSLQAIGLYWFIMSKPESWNFSIGGTQSLVDNGTESIRTAVHDLETAGFLKRVRVRKPDGTLDTSAWELFNAPTGNPTVDNPLVDAPGYSNTVVSKTIERELAHGMDTSTEPIGLPKATQTFKATRKEKAPFKPGGYSSHQSVSRKGAVNPDFQAFVTEINQDRRAFHIATTGGNKLWQYWIDQGYQPIQISVAARIAYRVDEFWKNNFSPDVFLRQTSKEGVALNNIDKYVNFRANGDPAIMSIKQELGGVQ